MFTFKYCDKLICGSIYRQRGKQKENNHPEIGKEIVIDDGE